LPPAILVSTAFALVHGFASITHRGNQIVSGVAINFIAAGATDHSRAGLVCAGRAHAIAFRRPAFRCDHELPGAEALRDVPFVGYIYAELISGHSILVYLAFLMQSRSPGG
jgi:ABC-type uncharacterized transport system permease subunit